MDNIKGDLRDYRLLDLLTGFQKKSITGSLHIESGSKSRTVFIKNGNIVSASSDDQDEQFGEFLLKQGRITYEEYNQSSGLSRKTGQEIKKVLVRLGYLTPEQLSQEVKHQVEEIILGLFAIEEGTFELNEGVIPEETEAVFHFNISDLIYKGITGINNFTLLKRLCPPDDAVLKYSLSPINFFHEIILDEADNKILSYVNGLYSVKMILMFSPLSDFETLKRICAFLGTGIIRIHGGETGFEVPEGFVNVSAEKRASPLLEKIELMYKRCETSNYYEILDIESDASPTEIKEAYYRVSKRFHHDRYLKDTNIKEKVMRILSFTTESYETLSDPEKRAEYDKNLFPETSEPEEDKPVSPDLAEESEAEKTDPEKRAEYDENLFPDALEPEEERPVSPDLAEEPKAEKTDEEVDTETEEDVHVVHDGLDTVTAEQASWPAEEEVIPEEEKMGKKRRLVYIPVIAIVTIILIIAFTIYEGSKKGPQKEVKIAEKKIKPLPPFRDELFRKFE